MEADSYTPLESVKVASTHPDFLSSSGEDGDDRETKAMLSQSCSSHRNFCYPYPYLNIHKAQKMLKKRARKLLDTASLRKEKFWLRNAYNNLWKFEYRRGKRAFLEPPAVLKSRARYRCIFQNGDVYEGECVGKILEGSGLRLYRDGGAYVGFWESDAKHGWGVYIGAKGYKYEGVWKNNRRHGLAYETLESGRFYTGLYKNDKRHGKGTLYDDNGMMIVGEWHEGALMQSHLLAHGSNVEQSASRKTKLVAGLRKVFATATPASQRTPTTMVCDKVANGEAEEGRGKKVVHMDSYNTASGTNSHGREMKTADGINMQASQRVLLQEPFECNKLSNNAVEEVSVEGFGQLAGRGYYRKSFTVPIPDVFESRENKPAAVGDKGIRVLIKPLKSNRCPRENLVDVTAKAAARKWVKRARKSLIKRLYSPLNKRVLFYYSKSMVRNVSYSDYPQFSATECLQWSMHELAVYLESIGCSHSFINTFQHHQIDGSMLPYISEGSLIDMGIRLWEDRRYLMLCFGLLLRLREVNSHRWVGLADRLRSNKISLGISVMEWTDVSLHRLIGSGSSGRVYEGRWNLRIKQTINNKYTFPMCKTNILTASTDKVKALTASVALNDTNSGNRRMALDIQERDVASNNKIENPKENVMDCGHTDCNRLNSSNETICVAVKVFKQRNRLEMKRNFYSELRVISRLHHPNITLFLGVITHPELCLVTEYVTYGTLFDRIHRSSQLLSMKQILAIAIEICCGMAYLHEQGIVHCDLKSPNILITENGSVKICDFGLASLAEFSTENELPRHLGCVGTLQWMAPEVLRKEAITKASDVYSFGVILWEMCTRRIPRIELGPANHIIGSAGYGGVSPPLPKGLMPPIFHILQKCLAIYPKDRCSFEWCCRQFTALYDRVDCELNLSAFFGETFGI